MEGITAEGGYGEPPPTAAATVAISSGTVSSAPAGCRKTVSTFNTGT